MTGIFAITTDIENRIKGKSYTNDSPVQFSHLRLLKVSYVNFDNKDCVGEIIVNYKVAEEVFFIFKELFRYRFPIYKITLIDDYCNDDEKSMIDNNCYSFSVRKKTGKQEFSAHAYGLAIDINPMQNPYIKGDLILPPTDPQFITRQIVHKGMIVEEDICCKLFAEKGWTWGGLWTSLKDYHHFEKNCINLFY